MNAIYVKAILDNGKEMSTSIGYEFEPVSLWKLYQFWTKIQNMHITNATICEDVDNTELILTESHYSTIIAKL